MKAVVYRENGGPEVLSCEEVAVHTPRVRAYRADIFRWAAEGDLDVLVAAEAE